MELTMGREHPLRSRALTNGQLYGVRVRAINEIGTGDWSAEVSGTWSTGTPAGPPLAPVASDAGGGRCIPGRLVDGAGQ